MPHIKRPLTADEVPEGVIVDLDSQRVERRSSKMVTVVDVSCKKCGVVTVLAVGSLRHKFIHHGYSGCCRKCHPRFRSKSNGGIRNQSGYRWLHEDLIEPEILEAAKKAGYYMTKRAPYLQEHRVVAYRKYGPSAFDAGILIRHLDGNKSNNSPENLALGTIKENNEDHMSSRRSAAAWRNLAFMLFTLLVRSGGK